MHPQRDRGAGQAPPQAGKDPRTPPGLRPSCASGVGCLHGNVSPAAAWGCIGAAPHLTKGRASERAGATRVERARPQRHDTATATRLQRLLGGGGVAATASGCLSWQRQLRRSAPASRAGRRRRLLGGGGVAATALCCLLAASAAPQRASHPGILDCIQCGGPLQSHDSSTRIHWIQLDTTLAVWRAGCPL